MRETEVVEKDWNSKVGGKQLNRVTSNYLRTEHNYKKCKDPLVLRQLKEDVCRCSIGELELVRETQLKMYAD